MNKTRTFLLSGLATMTLIIAVIETGFLNLESQPLIAQEDASGLTLEKDGEQVLIPLEEWVVVSSAYDPSNTVRGLYMGMTVDALRIQEKGESFEREIPMDEIGSIFRGKTKPDVSSSSSVVIKLPSSIISFTGLKIANSNSENTSCFFNSSIKRSLSDSLSKTSSTLTR